MTDHRWNIRAYYSTDTGFEFELICDAGDDAVNGFCPVHEDRRLPIEEIERILNDYPRLKQAADTLSAEDARTVAAHAATSMGDNHILIWATEDYARILSEGGEDEHKPS